MTSLVTAGVGVVVTVTYGAFHYFIKYSVDCDNKLKEQKQNKPKLASRLPHELTVSAQYCGEEGASKYLRR